MERFRCAVCRHTLSIPVRLVDLPAGPRWSLLDHHHVNPPRLDPGTYAIDEAPYGRDRVAGTFVLSPGDVRGTRFVHHLASIGCWSLTGWDPCMACERCGTLVASRTDDCNAAQETRLYPTAVLRQTCHDEADRIPDPFAVLADWDSGPPDLKSIRRHTRTRPPTARARGDPLGRPQPAGSALPRRPTRLSGPPTASTAARPDAAHDRVHAHAAVRALTAVLIGRSRGERTSRSTVVAWGAHSMWRRRHDLGG